MRALRFDKTGSLDALKVSDIPKPAPGPNEVLVEVKAAAVNPSDIRLSDLSPRAGAGDISAMQESKTERQGRPYTMTKAH